MGEKKEQNQGHMASAYKVNLSPHPPFLIQDTSLLCFQLHHNPHSILGQFLHLCPSLSHHRSAPGGSSKCIRISP